MARPRHLGWKSQTAQCLFRTSGGGSRPWQVAPIASIVWRVRTSVVPDLHSFTAVPFAVDQCSCVCQYPGGLRQRKRTETHEEAVGKVRLVPG